MTAPANVPVTTLHGRKGPRRRAGRTRSEEVEPRLVTAVPQPPVRPADGHKGTFGTVLVLAGSDGMLGAAILVATTALRAGAGLVQVALPAPLRLGLAVAVPAATSLPRSRAALAAAVPRASAVVVGPGLGQRPAVRSLVRWLLSEVDVPMVLDADALNLLAPLRRPLPGAERLVLTPHPGEAARLLATTTAAVQRDRAGALSALVARSGATVVLKGAGTLIGDRNRRFANHTGNAVLGTGGSGDVLAGLLGGLLAQGMEPFAAACLAVHSHGRAGDLWRRRYGDRGLLASDLPLAILEVLRRPSPAARRSR